MVCPNALVCPNVLKCVGVLALPLLNIFIKLHQTDRPTDKQPDRQTYAIMFSGLSAAPSRYLQLYRQKLEEMVICTYDLRTVGNVGTAVPQ